MNKSVISFLLYKLFKLHKLFTVLFKNRAMINIMKLFRMYKSFAYQLPPQCVAKPLGFTCRSFSEHDLASKACVG